MAADRRDIADRADLTALVTDFYTRVFADTVLGPIFVDIAHMDLAAHLPIICDFWETVLFRSGAYGRNALRVHQALQAQVALTPSHFARWLALWTRTVDDRHAGPYAEHAKVQAERIASSISRRLSGDASPALLTVERSATGSAGEPDRLPRNTAGRQQAPGGQTH